MQVINSKKNKQTTKKTATIKEGKLPNLAVAMWLALLSVTLVCPVQRHSMKFIRSPCTCVGLPVRTLSA